MAGPAYPVDASPALVSGLVGWWDATRIVGKNDGDAVSTWEDSSTGGALDASGPGPTYQTNEINGLPVVQWDQTDDVLSTPSTTLDLTGDLSFFAVVRVPVVVDEYRGLFSKTHAYEAGEAGFYLHSGKAHFDRPWGDSGAAATDAVPNNSPCLVSVVISSGALTYYLDTDANGTDTLADGTARNYPISLGRFADDWWPLGGVMGEILLFDVGVSTTDRQAVENYLGEKWGLGYGVTNGLYPSSTGLLPAYGSELAPTVTTGAESDVSYFSVTLNGTVDPNGLQTHYWFEYGLTTAYGSHTSEQNIGSGTDPVTVDDPLHDLADNTTYHYRLVARNGQGTSYGEDGTLTTLDALVPVVVTGAATDLTTTSATLNGTVDPEGQNTSAWFEYGLTTAYGSDTALDSVGSGTDPVAVSAVIPVDPFAIYHYRLVAWSLAGYAHGEDRTFTGLYGPAPLALIHESGKGQ